MMHLPILRAGRPYRSVDVIGLRHVQSGEPVAEVSQANPGLIARELAAAPERRRELARVPVAQLLDACRRAAALFAEAELPVDSDGGALQSPADYVAALSATTGLPHTLARLNMEKVRFVLAEMETVLRGLTRGLDLAVLDRAESYVGQADVLGVVLPNNSPGVHSLWLPSIPLKVPLALKPGRAEPWTPLRVCQSLAAAGCPAAALGFYPTDHAGATEILLRAERSMLFGDASAVRGWGADGAVQLHGPGRSKVLLGADAAEDWKRHLETIVTSIAENSGRSCLNASGVWLPARGRELAEALAQRLVAIEPRPLDDPEARLAASTDKSAAERVSAAIDRQLARGGAEDLTAALRGGSSRVAEADGCAFLLPTLVWCEDPEHPLAHAEFLFPFAAVVEVPQVDLPRRIGPTLVATAITDDERLRGELAAARNIDRLNLGPIPTTRIAWDQPHEGNLFEHLYRHRAFQGTWS